LFATITHAASGARGVAHYDDTGHFLELLPYGGEGASGMDVDDAGRIYIASNTLGRGSFGRSTPPYSTASGIDTPA